MRQAERRVLLDVGDADAELGPVADRGLDLGGGVADDDADVGDAGVADRLEAVEQHRLVGDRHQLLGGGVGDGPQPRACTTGQDQCLHAGKASGGRRPAPAGRRELASLQLGRGTSTAVPHVLRWTRRDERTRVSDPGDPPTPRRPHGSRRRPHARRRTSARPARAGPARAPPDRPAAVGARRPDLGHRARGRRSAATCCSSSTTGRSSASRGCSRSSDDRPEPAARDARTILVVGSDSRGDLAAGEGTQGTGEEFVAGQRSDTMILVHLYGDSDEAQLVSLPARLLGDDPGAHRPGDRRAGGRRRGQAQRRLPAGRAVAAHRDGRGAVRAAHRPLRADRLRRLRAAGRRPRRRRGVPVRAGRGRGVRASTCRPAGRRSGARRHSPSCASARACRARTSTASPASRPSSVRSSARRCRPGRCSTPSSSTASSTSPPSALQVDEQTSVDDLRDLALRFRTARGERHHLHDAAVQHDRRRARGPVGRAARPPGPSRRCSPRCAPTSRPARRAPRRLRRRRPRSSSRRRTCACGCSTAPASPDSGSGPTTTSRPSGSRSSTPRPTAARPRGRRPSYHGPDKADSARTLAPRPSAGARTRAWTRPAAACSTSSSAPDYTGARAVTVTVTGGGGAPGGPPPGRTAARGPLRGVTARTASAR